VLVRSNEHQLIDLSEEREMLNLKRMIVSVVILAPVILGACTPRVEVTTTPCDELGKTNDPAIQADLEKRCGHGGPKFKPTPKESF
jgi:hypothetical protein